MNRIFIGLLLILMISCKSKQINKDLDRPFIKSYHELDKECVNILSNLLKPYEIENDTLLIDKAYGLDVKFDSTLYSKYDLQSNYFIGIKLKPDSFDLIVFDIDFKIGAITTCRILPNEKLIINNMDYLFSDISKLVKCGGLNIADSLIKPAHNNKPMFRHKAWTNTMYGVWEIDSVNKGYFSDKRFNNVWTFKPEKGLALTNDKGDTLLIDSIDLQGNSLNLVKSKIEFEVVTQTKTKILIREPGSKNYIFLNKTMIK